MFEIPKSMRAAVYRGVNDLRIETLPVPRIAATSDAVLRQGLSCLRGGGKVLLFVHIRRGVTTGLDLAELCVDEKELIGSCSADFTVQREVARLVFSRQLDVRLLITHRFTLNQIQSAIALAASPTQESLKNLIMPA